MTKFILVRHGEANYDEVLKLGFTGQSLALAPLSEKEFLKYLRLALKEWETQNPNFECSDKTESLNHVKKKSFISFI